ncbi:MAG: ribosome silencing factor [Giesbergeria sp.]|uniref:ribosome silencing factor n=1 Tax=Giesbergeria sp. TaxID=2818473 RepID=UPI0026314197|nr:ribosome silencing factor [Giesbergeria sp.]MDD2608665.1 ribosome silencing factor [Giesbergeria sp.]
MTTTAQSESTAKKDVTKLQRAIVDGLEDVKAQDIQVFDTEHLSALFERVIVASGTSNRQTKALAASVRDAVREAGFAKPRTEGEDNGEWIIVDCGAAVVHIMQPTIRQYYRLEELWGEKPVRLKLGAAKPVAPVAKVPAKTAARRAAKAEAAAAEEGTLATAKKPAARKPSRASTAAAPAETPVAAKKPAARKTAAKPADATSTAAKAPAKRTAKSSSAAPAAPAAKKAIKTVVVKPRADKKAAPAKTTAAKKAPVRKSAPRSQPE